MLYCLWREPSRGPGGPSPRKRQHRYGALIWALTLALNLASARAQLSKTAGKEIPLDTRLESESLAAGAMLDPGEAVKERNLVLRILGSNQNNLAPGASCDHEIEYWHDKHCCSYCPAGTRVLKHCTVPHTMGICENCPLGEYALKNGLATCRQCAQCRRDEVMVKPCYGGTNTECHCKEGYYCEATSCEACRRCTERCPEGKHILQPCNATANTLCGVSSTGVHSSLWSLMLLVVIPITGNLLGL